MADRDQILRSLRVKFQTLCAEHVAKLNRLFVEMEQDPGNEALAEELMREIHTLKGEARMMRVAEIRDVAHRTEDLLIDAQERQFRLSTARRDLIVRGFDLMAACAERITEEWTEDEITPDAAAFVRHVEELLAREKTTPSPEEAPVDGAGAPNASALAGRPSLEKLLSLSRRQSIRVDVKKLDQLAELTGSLILAHGQFEDVLNELGRGLGPWSDLLRAARGHAEEAGRGDAVLAMHQLSSRLAKIEPLLATVRTTVGIGREAAFSARTHLNELEARTRELRHVPLAFLFEQYPRPVRDMAKELGKEVAVRVEGGEVEVDKNIIDQLSEPMLHLIRNSLDHGIEAPDERRAQGKPAQATLRLAAQQRGSVVEISVGDDGRGIDPEHVRAVAVRRGILRSEEAQALADDAIYQLLFAAGFSTREQATDVSGRGIGLNVVKQRIEALGGNVSLRTTVGQGSVFRVSLPVSVLLHRALVFEVGKVALCIAAESVSTVMDLVADQVEDAAGGTAFRWGGNLAPLCDLSALLGLEPRGRVEGRVVIVAQEGRHLGLVVDRVVGDREVVVRPWDRFVDGHRLFVASALLPPERIALMLNVPELFRSAGQYSALRRDDVALAAPARQRVVAIVDDSEMIRDVVVMLLRRSGCRVIEAINGRDALDRFTHDRPDVVVTDLDMPVLDGFALLQELRASPTLRHVPVVVFSTHEAGDQKRRALELGADAYLVKAEMQEENLLHIIGQVLAANR